MDLIASHLIVIAKKLRSVSGFLSLFPSFPDQLPRYKNFKGVIHEVGQNQYLVSGEVSVIDKNTIEIIELPVRTWTQVPGTQHRKSIFKVASGSPHIFTLCSDST